MGDSREEVEGFILMYEGGIEGEGMMKLIRGVEKGFFYFCYPTECSMNENEIQAVADKCIGPFPSELECLSHVFKDSKIDSAKASTGWEWVD